MSSRGPRSASEDVAPDRADAFLAAPAAAWELDLSTYFAERTSPPAGRLLAVALHPLAAARALRAVLRLPVLVVPLTGAVGAGQIRRHLARSAGLGRLPVLRSVVDVLPVPVDVASYSRGRGRQTLRQRARAARSAGVQWRRAEDGPERRRLVALAEEQERTHPMTPYRLEEPDDSDLCDYEHLLVALADDGTPLLLVAVAVDGEFALLRYFGTLGHGPLRSDTRFLMAEVLVAVLAPLGVRYLFNSRTPFTVPAGLRHFQRMLGWRLCRARVVGGPA